MTKKLAKQNNYKITEGYMNNFDELVEKWFDEKAMPGLNYSVINGDDVYQNSLGNKSLVPNIEPNSIDTVYDIASLTKVIAIVPIISRMLEKGLIRLDDKVNSYLKDFKYADVTISDLLTYNL